MTTQETTQIADVGRRVLESVRGAVVGMEEPLTIALAAILAGGHVLFEDVPGLGKTLAARSLASALGLDFRRLQCTPDMLPGDVTGSYVYAPAGGDFVFRPGPIFTGLLLADEVNRTTPKTQSAMLEAMAEGQVTVEGNRFPLPRPFHVVATSNPIEYEGTYALPEAQLDRFMVRLAVGYPASEDETQIILDRVGRRSPDVTVDPVVDGDGLLEIQAAVERIHVDPDVARYCVELARATRDAANVAVGASPRGSQALVLLGRALAALEGRDYVRPDDIKRIAEPVLAHRLTLTPQAWAQGVDPRSVVATVVATTPVPPDRGRSAVTEPIRVTARSPVRWRRTPVIAVGFAGAAVLAAAGLALSRPDVIGVGLPLALVAAWMLLRRPQDTVMSIELRARPGGASEESSVVGAADVTLDADWLQIAVDLEERRAGLADVRPGAAILTSRTRIQHSGPIELLGVTVRGAALDGAWVTEPAPRAALGWNAPPGSPRIARLPVALRLTGLHGAHEGARPGQGGDFRDIHPFAPGDELRRVDWRATARAARRPGELLVRRTNALSDSSVVIAVDTVENLGTVVAGWGTDDPDRSGVTSLDLAREAALAIATTAIGVGDRVAYHALSPGGRSIPSGGGRRHLVRVRDVIAATGQSEDDSRYRRSPVVPAGSIVFVLSTFVDGVAARLAARWRAAGHAVVAVGVLPVRDTTRLTREQRIALRTLLAERSVILSELRHAGVEVVAWTDPDVDVAMRLAALRQQRMRAVRR